MNQVWFDTTGQKIRKFLLKKIIYILIFGVIVGGGMTAFQWMKKNMIEQKVINNSIVTMKIGVTLKKGVILNESYCEDILKSDKVVDNMKQYLGGYEKYDSFKESVKLNIQGESLAIQCRATSHEEGKKILQKACRELEDKLKSDGKIEKMQILGSDKEEEKNDEEEHTMEDKLKINLVLGVLFILVMYIIDFVLKDYISESYEVSDYFNKQVLAIVPTAYRKEKKEYENNRNKKINVNR